MTNMYIISAPSGSGKSTLVNEVRKMVPGLELLRFLHHARAAWQRTKRPRIFLLSRAEFEEMIRNDEFLEHADVFGNTTAPPGAFCAKRRQKEHDLLLDIDVQGAAQIKKKLPEAVSIFILPPNRRNWSGGCVIAAWIRKRLSSAGWSRPLVRLRITPNTTIFW